MYSMTGYGASRLEEPSLSIFSEIRGVNGKFLQIKWNLPSALNAFEKHLENILRKRVKRGSLKILVQYDSFQEEALTLFNTHTARKVLFSLDQLKKELGLSGELGFEVVARIPGIFDVPLQIPELQEETLFKIEQTFSEALEAFQETRQQEGEFLVRLLQEILNSFEKKISFIENRLPQAMTAYYQRLKERVQLLIKDSGVELSSADLVREVAILSERSDVTEELDRLHAHIQRLSQLFQNKEASGKQVDFTLQEVLRETTTLGNKLQDKESLLLIPEMKLEIDKLKEQCQNLE
jgi:uncharacterized protein (TIGR00255 family)